MKKCDCGTLRKKVAELRKNVFEVCVKASTGHLTSSFSCLEILTALYHGGILRYDPRDPSWAGRDRFILSKGQASPAYYAVLASAGFFDPAELKKFAQKDGKFGVHLQNDVPGVEMTAGSLGHGLSFAAGLALAAKLNRELHMVYAMLGDGELYEGSNWEAAMFAAQHRLNNLVVFVDRNYLCVTDFTENLIALEPLEDKWKSFGWDVKRIDGHSFEEIFDAVGGVRSRQSTAPLVVIADTVKGKGISSVCYQPLWHAMVPKGSDEVKARKCLKEESND
jgi:transketolase